MPIGVDSPAIEHVPRGIVHRLPPESTPLEKVPILDRVLAQNPSPIHELQLKCNFLAL
jgi:hypothetical protein